MSRSLRSLANKDLILVRRVQQKTMIKAHFSGRMVSSGISDVAFPSIHSDKTHLKKLIMFIIITPHMQRERGEEIGVGVHIYYNDYIFLYVY